MLTVTPRVAPHSVSLPLGSDRVHSVSKLSVCSCANYSNFSDIAERFRLISLNLHFEYTVSEYTVSAVSSDNVIPKCVARSST